MISFIATELAQTGDQRNRQKSSWFCIRVRAKDVFEIHRYVNDVPPGVYEIPRKLVILPTEQDSRSLEEEFVCQAREGMVLLVEASQEISIMNKKDYQILMNL